MKSNTFVNMHLKHIFLNEEYKLGDYIYLSLHTKNPVGGTQSTGEVFYPGYKRVAVKRDASGWDVVDNAVSLQEVVSFPECRDKVDIEVTHLSLGVNDKGEGVVLYIGEFPEDEKMYISKGVIPQITPATTLVEC